MVNETLDFVIQPWVLNLLVSNWIFVIFIFFVFIDNCFHSFEQFLTKQSHFIIYINVFWVQQHFDFLSQQVFIQSFALPPLTVVLIFYYYFTQCCQLWPFKMASFITFRLLSMSIISLSKSVHFWCSWPYFEFLKI